MGKRKQPQNNAVLDSESTLLDLVQSERTTDHVKSNCQHIGRAVDLNSIKKQLKGESLKSLSCCVCSKEGVPPKKEENWVCLQCGYRICSLDHLKNHFKVPRSNLHAIAFSLHSYNVWCEPCNSLIPEDDNRKLKICVAFIKQIMDKAKQVQVVETPYSEDVPPPLVEWNESKESESAKTASVSNRKNYYNQPSVRGLINLGNTCFFNSVLQCLARTPKLVETLRRMESSEEQISITLKNGQLLEGALERSSDWLGQCLADTLVALCRPGDISPENPLRLLQLLRKKCPQFEGYEQHDAHELLRHLLDNVRQNDLKRYRSLMLNVLGLSRKSNPQDVSRELQKKVKSLDNEVVERVTLVPEHVFKGLLVSTLECQDCHNTSQCVESFLDLSLPIMADKPQPPSMIRRKGSTSPELVDEKAGTVSKHQLKKQAKQARKKVRNKYAPVIAADELPAAVDSHSDKGESEADVEDNEEDKPHESGYSSEKIHSESSSLSGGDDSARTSPTSHVKEGDIGNTRVNVCEGFGAVTVSSGSASSGLNPQPQYVPFLRVRRKPQESWTRVGGSLTPVWISHSDTTHIPNPLMIIDGGESWRNYSPRNGLSPSSAECKKDSQLNPITEETDKTKLPEAVRQESSVCDQVSLMSKVVETMLAQVHIRQEDLDKYENKSVTESRDVVDTSVKTEFDNSNCEKQNSHKAEGDCDRISCKVENVTHEISRFNPFNGESSSTLDKKLEGIDLNIGDTKDTSEPDNNKIIVSPESENNGDCKPLDSHLVQDDVPESKNDVVKNEPGLNSVMSATDDTSNGFHINSLYEQKNVATSTSNEVKTEKLDIGSYYQKLFRGEEQKEKKDPDEDKDSLDISPIFKEINNKKTEKKEEGDSVRVRRRFMDKEAMSRSQEFDSACSIQSCLSQFTAVEIMSGANRVGCSTCTQRHNKGNKEGKTVNTIASKQLLIKEVPQVLILHLKRFQVQMYSFRKLSKHVTFPLYLDLAPFCLHEKDEDDKILYCLYGVVEHSGNLNGGHYVAYIKVEEGETASRWFCISDSNVHEVTEKRVLQSQAYLLFYKRIIDESS